MKYPQELKYLSTDEWVKVEDGIATIGITDYAQDALSDVVYVEFEIDPDDEVSAGDSIGTIESVKAAAEVHFPVSGTVLEVNEEVVDTPEMLNQEPYEGGWLVKVQVSDESELDALMDAAAYEAYCQDR
ncbi:MAG TPA: glycine cleavage system protein GcvH [Anaerolineaceae bacterium]|nr:glycine cleavage system protein GcvH [Anaerolineaceae bacterium]HPX65769.1 glycine cleavage system protein GcvH [Anaerolineaceae bacterium]HQC64776.1 glycine cleavage system protein GcvH [Anaerolineaceae bacterium]HQL93001.1 glycine cleavage system protein GcvH [Anaerolineaceae bacterium]HQN69329.1 glycine cleavage system protein GcvH [Anaerolineaceae bacterium]